MASEIRQQLSREFDAPLSDADIEYWRSLPARQQPNWGDEWLIDRVRADLAGMPALVTGDETDTLRRLLARVASGELEVLQAGDCAEDPAECVPELLSRKIGLLDTLSASMRARSRRPVIRVGRIAGQFAKPRSRPVERHGVLELPVFRGSLVNSPEPDPYSRRPDPLRMLTCYQAASAAMAFLWGEGDDRMVASEHAVWTSHEALILDYELPMVRRTEDGRTLLTSTHWPWIGERTRQLDGAHVHLLATVDNPVACKIGPAVAAAEVVALCDRLDPYREPGRLTLVARLGAPLVTERLPRLVAAVRSSGHPVIWMCDPMHGNTTTTPSGHKTRLVRTVQQEVRDFRAAVVSEGGVPGGLHLETTPTPVHECVTDESEIGRVDTGRYTTLCDPRLNLDQALAVVSAWSDESFGVRTGRRRSRNVRVARTG